MKGAINLFHAIFVTLLFLYLGYMIFTKKTLLPNVGLALILLALVIFLYHLYRYSQVSGIVAK